MKLKWFKLGRRASAEPSDQMALATSVRSGTTIIGNYVQDRERFKARTIRAICWSLLLFSALLYGILYAFLPPSFIPPLLVPLLLLGSLVIWALPTKDYIPLKSLRFLFFGVAIALVGWPNYLAIALPGLPWITLTRVFILPLSLMFLVSLSTSPSLREQLKIEIKANIIQVRLLVMFVVLMAVSLAFSSNPLDSFQAFVIDQIYWTGMFFVALYLFSDTDFIKSWCWLLVGLGVWVSILALFEWRLGRLPWAGHIPSFLQINDPSVLRTFAGSSRAGAVLRRVEGTFPVSLGLGEFLALITPMMLHFSLEARKLWVRLSVMAMIPFIFFTIVNTDARVGSIGFVLALILYGAVWSVRRWKNDRNSFVGPALALSYPIFACIFLGATFVFGRLRVLVWGGSNTQSSNDARLAQFHAGWPKVFEAPLGHGVGQGGAALGYTNGEGIMTIDTYTLRLALEYGLVGMIVFYLFFALPILTGLRAGLRQDEDFEMLPPLCVSICVFLVIKTVYSSEFIHPILFMMAGGICAIITRSRRYQPS